MKSIRRDKNGEQPAGVQAEFADMLSLLPDAEPASGPTGSKPTDETQHPAAGGFSDMFADLPDAEPGAAQARSPVRRAADCAADQADFQLGPEVQASSGTAPATRPVSRAARAPAQPPTPAMPSRPVAPAPIDSRALSQQIIEHLESYKISAVSRLRIEVHDGVVVVAGEVPSAYEKQLVSHFCRQVPGVVKFVDGMVIRAPEAQKSGKAAAAGRRPARQRYEWELPFRAWHIGAAAGLLITIWAGYSFATRDGSRLSVYPVEGTVLFDGNPPEGATVTLHPTDRSQTIRPRGVVQADGSFELTTYLPSDGAPAGDYKVTVEWKKPVEVEGGDFIPGPNLLPESCSIPASTTIQATIASAKNELPPIEIKK